MVIPLIIFGLYTINSSIELANKEVEKSTEKTLELASADLERLLQHLVFISNDLYLDYKVNKALVVPSSKVPYSKLLEENQYVNDRLSSLTSGLGDAQFLFRITGFSGREFPNQIVNPTLKPLDLSADWYSKTVKHSGRIEWVLDETSSIIQAPNGVPVIVGVRIISNLITSKNIGVLAVGIRKSYIDASLNLSSRNGELLMAIERDGKIVANCSDSNISAIDNIEGLQTFTSGEIYVINNKKYLVSKRELEDTLWSLLLLTPINRYFAHVQRWQGIVISLLVFSVLISFTISSIVSSRISGPIIALSKDMKEVSKGDIGVRTTVYTNDEIGGLADSFNHMLDHINELMKNLQEEQRAKVDSELRALFSQINPHFIYNTLAGIRFMIGIRSDEEINDALLALTQFLRHLFATSNEIISIGEELDILTNYMRIQDIRSVGGIRFNVNIEKSIMNYSIPKLLIQPLVENAIFHGLGNSGGRGVVSIRAHELGNKIIFVVEDTPDNPDIASSDRTIESLPGTGIGLANVKERIKLYYGEKYGVYLNKNDKGRIYVELSIAKTITSNHLVNSII